MSKGERTNILKDIEKAFKKGNSTIKSTCQELRRDIVNQSISSRKDFTLIMFCDSWTFQTLTDLLTIANKTLKLFIETYIEEYNAG